MISKKHKKICTTLDYIDYRLYSIPIGIASSAVGLKICAITAGTKRINQNLRKGRRNM